jgi:exopolyphosphatase/pppGpp-phosphohydrolase
MTTLEWLLVTAAVALLVGTAVVVVQATVRDIGIDANRHRARFRTAEVAADTLTREWRAQAPDDQFEAEQINRRYSERCARLGITYADSEARPYWKAGLLATGGGWREAHKIPICYLRDVRGERERFGTYEPGQ